MDDTATRAWERCVDAMSGTSVCATSCSVAPPASPRHLTWSSLMRLSGSLKPRASPFTWAASSTSASRKAPSYPTATSTRSGSLCYLCDDSETLVDSVYWLRAMETTDLSILYKTKINGNRFLRSFLPKPNLFAVSDNRSTPSFLATS